LHPVGPTAESETVPTIDPAAKSVSRAMSSTRAAGTISASGRTLYSTKEKGVVNIGEI
jgi:hypothetical protein